MKGYTDNIEEVTLANDDYRRVLYTGKHSQLVLMCLRSGEEIGEEVHAVDQFIRFESGHGEVLIDGVAHSVLDEFAVVIPAGAKHNVKNTGDDELRLYTVYSPPEHKNGTVHKKKSDERGEHFDGLTTE